MVGWRVGTGRVLGAALEGRGEADVAHRVCGDGQGRGETAHKVAFSSRASVSLVHTLLHPSIGPTRRLVVNHIRDATRGGAPAMTGTPSNHRHTSVYVQEVGTEEARLERMGGEDAGAVPALPPPHRLHPTGLPCSLTGRTP